MTRCITRYLAISLFINCILANLYFILCIFFYKNQYTMGWINDYEHHKLRTVEKRIYATL
jgi:hypothetical protein